MATRRDCCQTELIAAPCDRSSVRGMEGAPNFRDERSFRDDSYAPNPFLSMPYLLDFMKYYFYYLSII